MSSDYHHTPAGGIIFLRRSRRPKSYYEKNVKSRPLEFQYQLLGRLELDCKYYLGNGRRNDKHLFTAPASKHIELMKDTYNGLNDKPEWINFDDIERYEAKMVG